LKKLLKISPKTAIAINAGTIVIKGSERIKRYLRNNRNRAYELHHHSTGNGRGVAILIAMSLNVVINREWKDQAENALLMDLALDNYTVTLGAIDGPNNTGREFFRFLNQALAESEGQYKVIGGDWNTVLDPLPIPQNIDVINMVGIPNQVNGTLLREMCAANSLSDPYRTVYPNKKDYTYTPFGDLRKNRSRLDFFIISDNLIPFIGHCSISSSVLCSQFDHKNISLSINCDFLFKKKKTKLTNSFLNSRYLGLSVAASAVETHLAAIDTNFNDNANLPANFATTADFIVDAKRQLHSLKNTLRELKNLELQNAKNDDDLHLDLLVSAKIASASLASENMPSRQTLSTFKMRCNQLKIF
jgi:exonuclease III